MSSLDDGSIKFCTFDINEDEDKDEDNKLSVLDAAEACYTQWHLHVYTLVSEK